MLLERQPANRPLRSGTLYPEKINLLGMSHWYFAYFSENRGFVRYIVDHNILYVSFLLGDMENGYLDRATVSFNLSTGKKTIIEDNTVSAFQLYSSVIDKGVKKHHIFFHAPFELALLEIRDSCWIPYHTHPEGIAEIYVDVENNNFERCFAGEHHCLENFSEKTKFVLAFKYPDEP